MDLRKLRHATTLAAERNFARAADKLHITQSALSQSIARLEAEAGFALFDRDRNGARPTSAGKSFLTRAETLLQHARNLQHETALLRGCGTGTIAFGFGPVPASSLMLPIMVALAKEYPLLTCDVKVAGTSSLTDELTAERLEFFVAASSSLGEQRGIAVKPLVRIRMGFFVRRKHPLAGKPTIDIRGIFGFPLLSPHVAEADRQTAKRNFGLSPDEPWPATIFCDDIASLRLLTLKSDGVLLGPHTAVAEDCSRGKLVELEPKGLKHSGGANVCVVSLAGRTLSPAAQMIIGRLQTLVQNQGV